MFAELFMSRFCCLILFCVLTQGGFSAPGGVLRPRVEVTVKSPGDGVFVPLVKEGDTIEQGGELALLMPEINRLPDYELALKKSKLRLLAAELELKEYTDIQAPKDKLLSRSKLADTELSSKKLKRELEIERRLAIMNLAPDTSVSAKEDELEAMKARMAAMQLDAKEKALPVAEQIDYKKTLMKVEQAELSFLDDRMRVEGRNLIAPVSGEVIRMFQRPHTLVSSGSELFRIVDASVLEAEILLNDKENQALTRRLKDKLPVFCKTSSGEKLEVDLHSLTRTRDMVTQRFRALLRYENSDLRFQPGERITILLDEGADGR